MFQTTNQLRWCYYQIHDFHLADQRGLEGKSHSSYRCRRCNPTARSPTNTKIYITGKRRSRRSLRFHLGMQGGPP